MSEATAENHDHHGPSRDLELAKKAYAHHDVDLMIAAHDANLGGMEEKHAGDAGDYIKSLVFGGLDGIITTFAIVSAAVGANLGYKTIITLGLANLVADAISMGLGDALSEKAEQDMVKREYKREKWEMEENPAGEIKEMIELYTEAGVKEEDAKYILNKMAEYPTFFVNHMMTVELGLQAPSEDDNPWAKGAVTFFAFIFFGSIPLLSYIAFAQIPGASTSALFGGCIAFTAVAIFFLGIVKGRFAQADIVQSGLLMMLNGGLAAAASFFIGWGLDQAL